MKGIEDVDRNSLILSANRALGLEIRPNMRAIYLDYIKEKNTVILYIYYDKPLTQEELDYDIPGVIICEMSCDFNEDITWEEKIIVIPFPEKIPGQGIVCVYHRYERYPEDDFK